MLGLEQFGERARWPRCSDVGGLARDDVAEEKRPLRRRMCAPCDAQEVGVHSVVSGGMVAAAFRIGCRSCGLGVSNRERAWGVLAGGHDSGALDLRFPRGGGGGGGGVMLMKTLSSSWTRWWRL